MFPLIKAAFMDYIHLVKLQKEVLPTHLPLTSVCWAFYTPVNSTVGRESLQKRMRESGEFCPAKHGGQERLSWLHTHVFQDFMRRVESWLSSGYNRLALLKHTLLKHTWNIQKIKMHKMSVWIYEIVFCEIRQEGGWSDHLCINLPRFLYTLSWQHY